MLSSLHSSVWNHFLSLWSVNLDQLVLFVGRLYDKHKTICTSPDSELETEMSPVAGHATLLLCISESVFDPLKDRIHLTWVSISNILTIFMVWLIMSS